MAVTLFLLYCFIVISNVNGLTDSSSKTQQPTNGFSTQLYYSNQNSLCSINLTYTHYTSTNTSSQGFRVTASRPTVLVSGLGDVTSADFLFDDGLFYWTDTLSQRIRMLNLFSSNRFSQLEISPDTSKTAQNSNQENPILGKPRKNSTAGISNSSGKSTTYLNKMAVASNKGAKVARNHREVSGRGRGAQAAPVDVVKVGLQAPDGVACDWVGRKIYWVDSERGRIEVAELDGSNRKVLYHHGVDQPKAIVLDPKHGYLYWTDWGEHPHIERAGMNGDPSTRQIIIDQDIKWPNALTLDPSMGRIFWSDSKLGYIDSALVNGTSRIRLVSDPHIYPSSLTVSENMVFWSDWNRQAIFSCDKFGGQGQVVTVLEQLYSPSGLKVFESKSQRKVDSTCRQNNGGCSHLCLLSPMAPHYTCSCPTGVQLLSDGKTCANNGDMLVLVRRTDLRTISVVEGPDQFVDVVLDLPNVRHAVMSAYDPVDRCVYWTDVDTHSIRRAYLNGSEAQLVIGSGLGSPDGIAVDWISRNLYWSDMLTNQIEVSRLDGTSRAVIVKEGLDEPRAIVLDPLNGRIYWSDWGANAHIGCAYLDGSGRKKIVETDIIWPNGLTLDYSASRLYWADAQLDIIEAVNTDGSGRFTVVAHNLPHVFGLTLLGDYLYWTDWQDRSVERILKLFTWDGLEGEGDGRELIMEGITDVMGVTAVTSSYQTGTNECSRDNGGCSHLCLYRPPPLGAVCACPFPLKISLRNKKICISPEAFIIYSQRDSIRQMSLVNGSDFLLPINHLQFVTSIDIHYAEQRIYWADRKTKTINRSFLNGTEPQTIVSDLQGSISIAVDWLAGNLYWTDLRGITVSRLDGSFQRIIVWDGISAGDIKVDPERGYIFWINTTTTQQSSIERAWLDGSHRKTLISRPGETYTSLTLDSASRTIYWSVMVSKGSIETKNNIESCNYDGKAIRLVVSDVGEMPLGVAINNETVYWSDKNTRAVLSVGLTNGSEVKIERVIGLVTDMLVYHPARQTGWNLCSTDGSRCPHLCISGVNDQGALGAQAGSTSHKCECATHYELVTDDVHPEKVTCKEHSLYLLLSKKTNFSLLSVSQGFLDGGRKPSNPGPDTLLPLYPPSVIRALDYSPPDDQIFWIDRDKNMWSSQRNGSQIRQLNIDTVLGSYRSGVKAAPFDLKLNPSKRLIYWTDSARNVISVLSTNGSVIGDIFNDPVQKPRHIALAISRGLIFWSNLGRSPSIERAEMDGTSHQTLFNTNIVRPGSLTVDRDQLFWSDIDLHRIETSDIHGYNRRSIISSVSDPIGLASSRGWLFWIDKEPKAVMALRYEQQGAMPVVLRRMDMTVLNLAVLSQREEGCEGGCSHICVKTPDGDSRCSCPHGYQLSKKDGKTCELVARCSENYFQCGTPFGGIKARRGGKRVEQQPLCISLQWQCDGQPDCPDSSDEFNCSSICHSVIGDKHFRCRSGKCCDMDERCDGVKNCDDGSDEDHCMLCSTGQPRNSTAEKCTRGTCFSEEQLCNGKITCDNSYDESSCLIPGFNKLSTKTPQPSASLSIILVLCGVGGSLFLICLITLVFNCCRHPRSRCHSIASPTKPKKAFCVAGNLESSSSSQPGSTTSSMQVSLLPISSGSGLSTAHFPPGHLMAYSSDGSGYNLNEPLNPPPTPATTARSPVRAPSFVSDLTSIYSERFLPGVHYPTPCSTEVGWGAESLAPTIIYPSSDCGGYETEPLNPPPPPTPYDLSSDERSSLASANVPISCEQPFVYKQRSRFRRGKRSRQPKEERFVYGR